MEKENETIRYNSILATVARGRLERGCPLSFQERMALEADEQYEEKCIETLGRLR